MKRFSTLIYIALVLAVTGCVEVDNSDTTGGKGSQTTGPKAEIGLTGDVRTLVSPDGNTAILTFVSDRQGTYYYGVVDATVYPGTQRDWVKGMSRSSGGDGEAAKGINSILLTDLEPDSLNTVYIVVEDGKGELSPWAVIPDVNPVKPAVAADADEEEVVWVAPVLSMGAVSGLATPAGTTATLTFTSDKEGSCYCLMLDATASKPTNSMVVIRDGKVQAEKVTEGQNTVFVTALTPGSKYKAYIVVVPQSGAISAVLTISNVNPVATAPLPEPEPEPEPELNIPETIPTQTPYKVTTLSQSGLNTPSGVAVDSAGSVYVADTGNNLIRKIGSSITVDASNPYGVAISKGGKWEYTHRWIVSLEEWEWFEEFLENPPPWTIRSPEGLYLKSRGYFENPVGIAINNAGNKYISVPEGNSIWKLIDVPYIAIVDTFYHSPKDRWEFHNYGERLVGFGSAGYADGTRGEARFDHPHGLAFDSAGYLYVADTGNNCIRKVSPKGTVTTLAGSTTAGYADGNRTAAKFNAPWGVAVDSEGSVYVADTGNHRIRKISPSGYVITLAGNGVRYSSADGVGVSAGFWEPRGIAVDNAGNLYVADTGNNKIRKITN